MLDWLKDLYTELLIGTFDRSATKIVRIIEIIAYLHFDWNFYWELSKEVQLKLRITVINILSHLGQMFYKWNI